MLLSLSLYKGWLSQAVFPLNWLKNAKGFLTGTQTSKGFTLTLPFYIFNWNFTETSVGLVENNTQRYL